MERIQFDLFSKQAEKFMEIIRPLLPDSKEGEILKHWNCEYSPDSKGAYLFEKFYRELLEYVLGELNFGKEVTDFLLDKSEIFVGFYHNFDQILLSEKSVWFIGKTREEIFNEALSRSLTNCHVKTWGSQQKIIFKNIFFGGKLPKFLGFDRGPVILKGGRATPHQGQIYESAGRLTTFAPSYRFVTDLKDDHISSTLAGGPSDRRFSKWYCSELKGWLEGKYKRVSP